MSGPQPYRHLELLDFIRTEVETHGIPPSLREMQVRLGVTSKSVITQMLWRLEVMGSIRRRPKVERGIELLQTKDYHLPNCACGACAERRYLAQLKLVEGLYRTAEIRSGVYASNFRPINVAERCDLLGISKTAVSRKRPALPMEAR